MTAATSIPNSRFLTPAELADRLNVSYQTVFRWIRTETIKPTFAEGRIIRFSVEDVVRQLRSSGAEVEE